MDSPCTRQFLSHVLGDWPEVLPCVLFDGNIFIVWVFFLKRKKMSVAIDVLCLLLSFIL